MSNDPSAASAIRVIFNGPALAGIGATTDAGLVPAKYHALPWSPVDKVDVKIADGVETIKYTYPGDAPSGNIKLANAIKTAIYNVDNIYQWESTIGVNNSIPQDVKDIMKRDCVAILFVMMAHGYYDGECREQTKDEKKAIASATIPDGFIDTVLNAEALNRAATFILARMHTKYQTNHVLGGSPMQASVASAVRAFYGISPGVDRDATARAKCDAVANMLHWALHPANERLLIPAVIDGSFITSARVHAHGPKVTALGKEEYFAIRAKTPPASTHHYYVAASAVQHLEPLGILPYMPSVAQMKDIKTGWLLIATHGAKLHPAARYWGLTRISANQKLVEPVCADLGYAVRKLMPNSSLAASPILAKEEALNTQWKAFIDSIRASMDQRGEEMLDQGILEEIKKSIMPTRKDSDEIVSVKRLMIQSTSASSADDADGDQDDDDSEHDEDTRTDEPDQSDDDHDDGPPPGAGASKGGDQQDDSLYESPNRGQSFRGPKPRTRSVSGARAPSPRRRSGSKGLKK